MPLRKYIPHNSKKRWYSKYGPRAWSLIALGVLCMARSIAYMKPKEPIPEGVQVVTNYLPLQIVVLAWASVGFICFASAFTSKHWVAVGAITGMSCLWLIGFTVAAAKQTITTGEYDLWLTVASLGAFVVLIWNLGRMQNITAEELREINSRLKEPPGDDDGL